MDQYEMTITREEQVYGSGIHGVIDNVCLEGETPADYIKDFQECEMPVLDMGEKVGVGRNFRLLETGLYATVTLRKEFAHLKCELSHHDQYGPCLNLVGEPEEWGIDLPLYIEDRKIGPGGKQKHAKRIFGIDPTA